MRHGCEVPPAPGRVRCVAHLAIAKAEAAARYVARRKGERCYDCNKPSKTGRCTKCAKKFGVYLKKYCANRAIIKREKGICLSCSKQASPGKKYCKRHLASMRDRERKRRQQALVTGICYRCKRPAKLNKQLCAFHFAEKVTRSAKRRRDAAKKGICFICKWPAVRGRQRCQYCLDIGAKRVKESRHAQR